MHWKTSGWTKQDLAAKEDGQCIQKRKDFGVKGNQRHLSGKSGELSSNSTLAENSNLSKCDMDDIVNFIFMPII